MELTSAVAKAMEAEDGAFRYGNLPLSATVITTLEEEREWYSRTMGIHPTMRGQTPMPTVASLRRQLAQVEAQLTRLEAMPDDDFENGNVIVFEKKIGARTYSYAAIKAGGSWYRTGRQLDYEANGSPHNLSWQQLMDFIGDGNWSTITYVTAEEPLL